MTTARQIITSALTTGLNRLSAGETLDDDLAALCLSALNDVVDSINGAGGMLWRQVATTQTVSGSSAALSLWGLAPGATISVITTPDQWPVNPSTFEAIQTLTPSSGTPTIYAHAGDTLHFYPAPTSVAITVASKEAASEFADLDTDYSMPDGWRSGLAALLAEEVAVPVLGDLPGSVARKAAAARRRLMAKVEPAILNPGSGGDVGAAFFRGA
jgi:hypothetical protein